MNPVLNLMSDTVDLDEVKVVFDEIEMTVSGPVQFVSKVEALKKLKTGLLALHRLSFYNTADNVLINNIVKIKKPANNIISSVLDSDNYELALFTDKGRMMLDIDAIYGVIKMSTLCQISKIPLQIKTGREHIKSRNDCVNTQSGFTYVKDLPAIRVGHFITTFGLVPLYIVSSEPGNDLSLDKVNSILYE